VLIYIIDIMGDSVISEPVNSKPVNSKPDGQLLMISDIEGCLKTNSNNGLDQNTSLCDITNNYWYCIFT